MADKLLEMRDIVKNFPGVLALNKVNFSVGYGEVHALMGENGAGKSTLIKILTGIHDRDSGDIIFDGKSMNFHSATDAQSASISTIYQEINLIPYLSVSENIFLGREIKHRGKIDWEQTHRKAKEIIEEMGLHIDERKPLNTYSTATQQMIAIARAIFVKAKLVVMDEPTSSLDENETKVLFEIMRKLKSQNVSIIFITHRLSEIYEICDKVTILKDGNSIGEYHISGLTKLDLVSKMIGGDASTIFTKKYNQFNSAGKPIVLKATNVKTKDKLRGINLEIKQGEIVGLAGLLGSGRTEFAKVIFGDDTHYEGVIEIENNVVKLRQPKNAIEKGFAFCSEDRKVEGIFPNLSVRENMSIAKISDLSVGGIVNKKKELNIVNEYIKNLSIKTPGNEQAIRNLSGGNQQKVLLARWLSMNPKLIILDEPTRGIDVGAKSEIENLIQEMSKKNIGVLMISSEIEELVRNCHKVIVMRDGKDVGVLSGDEISESNIMEIIAHEKTDDVIN